MADLQTVVGIFGAIFALGLFLAPLPMFERVKNDGTAGISILPPVMTLISAIISFGYGFLLGDWLVMGMNGFGAALECYYVGIFLIHVGEARRFNLLVSLGLLLGVVGIFEVGIFTGVEVISRGTGIVAMMCSTLMHLSGAVVLWNVCRARNVEGMPLLTSVATFLCALSWFAYGILGDNIYIMIPNSVGAVIGGAQLITHLVLPCLTPRQHDDVGVTLLS